MVSAIQAFTHVDVPVIDHHRDAGDLSQENVFYFFILNLAENHFDLRPLRSEVH